MNCKNCKHWDTEDPPQKGWGDCNLGESRGGNPTTKNTLAVAQDAESWAGFLQTHKTFGCVQFEVKQ